MNTERAADLLPLMEADSLKQRFKARCAGLGNSQKNWQVRVHRSISWSKRAALFAGEQPEAKFLFLWIALNSLYSRWSVEKNAPDFDSAARGDFFHAVCRMNGELIGTKLKAHRGLIKKLLGDPFLSDIFWREPDHQKAKGWGAADANYLDQHLKSGEFCKVLTLTMQRLFVLRGQLVHGSSSGGSKLNRSSLKYCLALLEIFVPVIQHIVIEEGRNDDWPELCYPPQ